MITFWFLPTFIFFLFLPLHQSSRVCSDFFHRTNKMSSFEPIVLIYGSPQSVASANLRLPVSSLFAFDIKSFENILKTPSQLTNPCLYRYFIILLESIDQDLLLSLHSNHRIISIHHGDKILSNSDQDGINRMRNSFRQITLDLTNDIIRFLTFEGQKQLKLERISLVKIYYQQARILKEWSMSLFKVLFTLFYLLSINLIIG